jgi:hypothetical protein
VNDVARALSAVSAFVRRYVVMSDEQLAAVALWTFHTHVFDAAGTTPYLSVTSPEKESGKTLLLEVLEKLVARSWLTGRVTAAVLARKVHAEKPTLLLDESDAAFNGDREYAETLRGILNSGYRRSGKASVCVGQGVNISYVDLSTFCPKTIAGIGDLPDTVASRSIPLRLKRKAPDEEVERFYERKVGAEAEPLHQALATLGTYHVDTLAEAEPGLPEELPDRAADCWEPLLAIADLAGGDWPKRARRAAIALSGRGAESDDSIGVQLLADCRPALDEHDCMFTKDLIAFLRKDEEAPWATWHRGESISPRSLARLLHRFGIRSRTIRIGNETAKGYHREQFEDAWRRYVPPSHTPDLSVTTSQPASVRGLSPFSIRHTTPLVMDSEQASKPHEQRDVTDVTDRNGGWEQGAHGSNSDEDTSEADYWADRIRALGLSSRPVLGDEGYPELVLAPALMNEQITGSEVKERHALHKLVAGEA